MKGGDKDEKILKGKQLSNVQQSIANLNPQEQSSNKHNYKMNESIEKQNLLNISQNDNNDEMQINTYQTPSCIG